MVCRLPAETRASVDSLDGDGRTTGAYCTLCNVTDGSRYYDSDTSSCLACSDDVTAATIGLVLGVMAAVLVALATLVLIRRRFSKQCGRLYKWGINLYLGLNLRSKLKQLVTLYQIITKLETVFQVPMVPSKTCLTTPSNVVTTWPQLESLPTPQVTRSVTNRPCSNSASSSNSQDPHSQF